MIQPLSIGTKVEPDNTRNKAHWAKRAACIGCGTWQIIIVVSMLQVLDQGPDCKEETTTQIITSTRVVHLVAIPIILWFLALPTSFEAPDQHLVKRVQS